MGMTIGTAAADQGMSKEIFAQMDLLLAPPLQKAVDEAAGDAKSVAQQALDKARTNWKQLAFAIANGVINHVTANMEITGIQTTGDVAAAVNGASLPGGSPPHPHPITLTATQQSVTFKQSGSTAGHVS
jgi:Flp pilus assembly protein TadG